ncbi:MAG: hypothetical protein HY402_06270 [Elusimicrobia bacterium]|nr:hypothetical protein [Elusimicrobiota bacterium]
MRPLTLVLLFLAPSIFAQSFFPPEISLQIQELQQKAQEIRDNPLLEEDSATLAKPSPPPLQTSSFPNLVQLTDPISLAPLLNRLWRSPLTFPAADKRVHVFITRAIKKQHGEDWDFGDYFLGFYVEGEKKPQFTNIAEELAPSGVITKTFNGIPFKIDLVDIPFGKALWGALGGKPTLKPEEATILIEPKEDVPVADHTTTRTKKFHRKFTVAELLRDGNYPIGHRFSLPLGNPPLNFRLYYTCDIYQNSAGRLLPEDTCKTQALVLLEEGNISDADRTVRLNRKNIRTEEPLKINLEDLPTLRPLRKHLYFRINNNEELEIYDYQKPAS